MIMSLTLRRLALTCNHIMKMQYLVVCVHFPFHQYMYARVTLGRKRKAKVHARQSHDRHLTISWQSLKLHAHRLSKLSYVVLWNITQCTNAYQFMFTSYQCTSIHTGNSFYSIGRSCIVHVLWNINNTSDVYVTIYSNPHMRSKYSSNTWAIS